MNRIYPETPDQGVISRIVFLLAFTLSGCIGNSGEIDPSLTTPAPATTATGALTVNAISASPSVLPPGQDTILTVTASTTSGGTLSYRWHAADGTLTGDGANPSTWKAPATEGSYRISVDVSDGASTVRAYVTVIVSVVPVTLTVTAVLPAEAKVDDSIRIFGAGFGATQGGSTVSLGSLPIISIQSWSDSEIHAKVPAGAATGDVTATVGGAGSNPARLTILWDKNNPVNVAVETVEKLFISRKIQSSIHRVAVPHRSA